MADRKDCPMRHENGNCLPAGGFCTSVNDSICEALHNAYECGAKMEVDNVIILPCRKGDTVYKIRKFCDENTGYQEFYRPTKEFDKPCQYFEEIYDGDLCHYPDLKFDEKWYCNLDYDIHCDICKERFAVQADRFDYYMLEHIYNTPMFNKILSLENILFLTKEEAEDALDKYLKGEWPNG